MNTVAATIDAWLEHRQALADRGALAASTLRNQRQIARTITAALGERPITKLRKSHVDLFVADRRRTCADVTVHEEVSVLRQILTWAVDEQIIAERPRLPTVGVPNVERALPSDADFVWFLRTMSPKHSDALTFMLLTGLAPHELERLRARDFDALTRELLIGFRPDFRVKTASRRRRVPLNAAATTIWVRSTIGLDETVAPFPSTGALQKAMRRHFLERADAPPAAAGLTPKMMRKWFASKVAKDYSEAVLQRLLGHAPGSPITRRHYVRSQASDLTDAVQGVSIQ